MAGEGAGQAPNFKKACPPRYRPFSRRIYYRPGGSLSSRKAAVGVAQGRAIEAAQMAPKRTQPGSKGKDPAPPKRTRAEVEDPWPRYHLRESAIDEEQCSSRAAAPDWDECALPPAPSGELGEHTPDDRAAVRREAARRWDIDAPLGFHLLPATKEKIWRGEYVDIFSLLYREEEEDSDRPTVKENLDAWLYSFMIYHAVVIEKDLSRSPELVNYQNIILRMYFEYGGNAWLQYDKAFRMWAEMNKSLRWDCRVNNLWLNFCLLPNAVRTDSGHLIHHGDDPAQAPSLGAERGVRPIPAVLRVWETGLLLEATVQVSPWLWTVWQRAPHVRLQ
ncbi:uncharacterized protein [Erythrolamprus reginae]|uniref:uncharacterized protein n=1 Tax=Erythrolamprus reginae TaxID=121349 RepID=UPI00396CA4F4